MPAAGDNVASSDVNKALDRRIGTFTGDTDLTALAYTGENTVDTLSSVPLVSGRTYRVRYVAHAIAITGNNTLTLRLKAAGNQITYVAAEVVTTNIRTFIVECDYTSGVTGNVTFTTTAARSAGSNNSQFRGATSQPRSLTVEYAYG